MGRTERWDGASQFGIVEVLHRNGVLLPRLMGFEDAVMYIAGDEAELLGRIVYQGLERIAHVVYRGLWLVCFVDHVLVPIRGRWYDVVAHLCLHHLPLPHRPENLQHSVDRPVTGGRELRPVIGNMECRRIKEREGLLQSASKVVALEVKM